MILTSFLSKLITFYACVCLAVGALNFEGQENFTIHEFVSERQQSTWNPINCDGNPRLRKEIRDLSEIELNLFKNGIIYFRNTRSRNGLSLLEQLTAFHARHVRQAHGGCYFLPWHAMFLLLTENLVRSCCTGVLVGGNYS